LSDPNGTSKHFENTICDCAWEKLTWNVSVLLSW